MRPYIKTNKQRSEKPVVLGDFFTGQRLRAGIIYPQSQSKPTAELRPEVEAPHLPLLILFMPMVPL